MMGGFLAGAGAVALALLKHKQREEIYHEAEIKAMDELDQMMEQADACADCTCAEECASLEEQQGTEAEAAEQSAEPAAEEPEEESPAEETPAAE